MSPPTQEEINVHDSLDERTACAHFSGKSLAEAEALFIESPLYYQGDLMWMGPVAFRFYVQAAVNYIRSEQAMGESDFINGFAGTLKHRFEWESESLAPIAAEMAAICAFVVKSWSRFDVDVEIYGDLLGGFEALEQNFLRLADQWNKGQ